MGRTKKFNETSRILTIRVPSSKYNEIKTIVKDIIEIPNLLSMLEKIEKAKKEIPDFETMQITQDDLWILYRLKFGRGTRQSKKDLLPIFTKIFNRNLTNMKLLSDFKLGEGM